MSDSLEQACNKDLNDKIISLPDILCAICKRVLCSPIVLVANIGNVCGLCRKKIDSSDPFIINSALENILKQLVFPCEYQENGCTEKINYWNLQTHQQKCNFQYYACPMLFFNDCEWHGPSALIVDHFNECHPNFLKRQSGGNSFHIDIDISKSSNYGLLLTLNNEQFFLHIRCDVLLNKLWYVMYYLGDIENAASFHYNVEQRGSNNSSIKFESNLTVLPGTEFTKDFDLHSSLSFDLSFLKQLIREPTSFTSIIRILSHNLPYEEIDEKVLNIFECPVCSNYMKPPIFQCFSGHSVCNKCRPKLPVCPTCRSAFGNTRNYSLESLSNGVRFPCSQRELGCFVVLSAAGIIEHEQECVLRPYRCPLNEIISCHWEGKQLEIIPHLKSFHNNKVHFTNYFVSKISMEHSITNDRVDLINYMTCFGEVFKVWFRHEVRDQQCYWGIELMESKGAAKNFKYEIGLINQTNKNHSLTLTQLCAEFGAINLTNFCNIPVSIFNKFLFNGEVHYFCKIFKISK